MVAVSVLLPTYNQAAFLPDALAGIDGQTFRDFELIACDDGSTDDTAAILTAAKVRTVTRPDNGGTAGAINLAATLATGDLMTWVSSDNVMHAEWLWAMVRELDRRPYVGAVYSAYYRLEHGDRALVQPGEYRPDALVASESCYFGPSFLIRREVWQEHRGKSSHDFDSWARVEEACWSRGLTLGYVAEPLCDYRHGSWCTAVAKPGLYDAGKWRAEALERRACALSS